MRDGIPLSGVVSVILRGMPRDRNGIVGAEAFFSEDWASADLCSSSVRSWALLVLRFSVKCLTGAGCWPTCNQNMD